jgi:glycosyltransferase involved in cell wall biosynthesis
MRILIVSDWSSDPGGSELYIAALRDVLRAQGEDVTLVTCGPGDAGAGYADQRVRGASAAAAQAVMQIVNPFAAVGIRALVRRADPQVALVSKFAYHTSPAVFAPLRGVPTVVMVHDYKPICPIGLKLLPDGALCTERAGVVCWRQGCTSLAHWLRDRPRYVLIGAALARADRVVCASRWMQRELAAEGILAEHIPLPVAPPGPAFRRAPAPSPTFVYCGRLVREKGVTVLLRSFAQLRQTTPTARLRIVGGGSERAELERLAAALAVTDAVSFTGWVEPAHVEHQLVDAWALVAPSLWAEPFGLVAPEAIVRGVPVIASRAGGFAETVEPGITGLLFPNGDEDALLRCMQAVAEGRAFPTRAIPPDIVERVVDATSPHRHAKRIGAVLAEAVGARASIGSV